MGAIRTFLPAPSVPAVISDRQFFQQLAIMDKITQEEALAAVQTGMLPQSIANLVAQLPNDQQFAAKMLLCGATSFERSNVFVPIFGVLYGMSDSDLDALWQAAGQL